MIKKFLAFSILVVCMTSTWATPLISAIQNNDIKAIQQLLQQGANINQKDTLGYTPLMVASGLGYTEVVQILLNNGADILILDTKMGVSALHKAAQSGVPEVAKLLLEHGSFIDLQAPTLGHTALIDAVWHKNKDMVAYLLASGANVNLKTVYGASALDLAKRDQLTEIVALFEKHQKEREEKIKNYSLMVAVRKNDIETVKKLIADGANVNQICVLDGHTPLLIASREGYTEIVAMLLEAGADPTIVDGQIKATPGHKAGYRGHPKIAELLIKSGRLEIDAQGPYNGYTALHDAIWHNHIETAKVYINAGAKLDLKGNDGRTPLEMAIQYGYWDIVKLLQEKSK